MTVALITFVCTFGAALAATFIRGWLLPTHLGKESQDVVRLGIGLVATMTALLLGIVTASARSTFDSQDAAVRNSAAALLTLDRLLARYGPETKRTRDLIRSAVAFRLKTVGGRTTRTLRHSRRLKPPHRSKKSKTRFSASRPRTTRSAGSSPKP
jgi:uncharacterized membrane protein (DUF485 family)